MKYSIVISPEFRPRPNTLLRAALPVLAGLALAAPSVAQTPAQAPAKPAPKGYLSAAAMPDTAAILGAPPAAGSAAEAADKEIYHRTRAMAGTPRWTLAQKDADNRPGAILADFSCALNTVLSPATAPRLAQLFDRAGQDASAIIARSKDAYKRPRPFIGTSDTICTPDDKSVLTSTSYPSGHATRSWAYGLILAELAPDRATPVMVRARVYGDSRIVCGVHYASDVKAGRDNATVLVAALHADPAFESDLAEARAELAALRQRGGSAPDGAVCAAEQAAAGEF